MKNRVDIAIYVRSVLNTFLHKNYFYFLKFNILLYEIK